MYLIYIKFLASSLYNFITDCFEKIDRFWRVNLNPFVSRQVAHYFRRHNCKKLDMFKCFFLIPINKFYFTCQNELRIFGRCALEHFLQIDQKLVFRIRNRICVDTKATRTYHIQSITSIESRTFPPTSRLIINKDST